MPASMKGPCLSIRLYRCLYQSDACVFRYQLQVSDYKGGLLSHRVYGRMNCNLLIEDAS